MRILLLALVTAALGCASPLSPREVRTLGDAERLWAARNFRDYQFELRRSCFCPLEFHQWARVEVASGRVTRVIFVDTGTEVPPAQLSWYPAVEAIFEAIRAAASNNLVKDVVAEFDQALGFPSVVNVISKPNVQDGDISYHLRNAGPL